MSCSGVSATSRRKRRCSACAPDRASAAGCLKHAKLCVIEDYVHSEVISRDFFDLARAERVKSALAVPLLSQNVVTGVLEVWRRRPSQFTPQHTAELATLANLASIAIENVCLTQARESAGRRLG